MSVRSLRGAKMAKKQRPSPEERLAQLEKRRQQINAAIQQIRARWNQDRRKQDTRRKILAGAWVLLAVERGEFPREVLLAGLDGLLERDQDRALFDLPPRQPRQKG